MKYPNLAIAGLLLLAASCAHSEDGAPSEIEAALPPPVEAAPADDAAADQFHAPLREVAETREERKNETLLEVQRELELEMGHPYATDGGQCRLLALGFTPCGAPERYVAYSSLVRNEAKVQELAQLYNRLARAENSGSVMPRDCEPAPEMTVQLDGSVCAVQPSRKD